MSQFWVQRSGDWSKGRGGIFWVKQDNVKGDKGRETGKNRGSVCFPTYSLLYCVLVLTQGEYGSVGFWERLVRKDLSCFSSFSPFSFWDNKQKYVIVKRDSIGNSSLILNLWLISLSPGTVVSPEGRPRRKSQSHSLGSSSPPTLFSRRILEHTSVYSHLFRLQI